MAPSFSCKWSSDNSSLMTATNSESHSMQSGSQALGDTGARPHIHISAFISFIQDLSHPSPDQRSERRVGSGASFRRLCLQMWKARNGGLGKISPHTFF